MQLTDTMLAEVGASVLEMMAFAMVMPDDGNAFVADDADGKVPPLWATVQFAGPFSGRLGLAMPRTVLAELAGNMLIDPGDPQQQLDALGEMANVICGNLLPTLAGPAPVFTLTRPQVCDGPMPAGAPSPGGQSASTRLCLMDGWVEIAVTIDPPAGPDNANAPAVAAGDAR